MLPFLVTDPFVGLDWIVVAAIHSCTYAAGAIDQGAIAIAIAEKCLLVLLILSVS